MRHFTRIATSFGLMTIVGFLYVTSTDRPVLHSQATTFPPLPGSSSAAQGDYNGDGIADLAVGEPSSTSI